MHKIFTHFSFYFATADFNINYSTTNFKKVSTFSCILSLSFQHEFFQKQQISTLKDTRVEVSHLQFADDSLFLGDWSSRNAQNLMILLDNFGNASGLKLNLQKSHLFEIGVFTAKINRLAPRIYCASATIPFTYLGLPIGANKKRVASWKVVEQTKLLETTVPIYRRKIDFNQVCFEQPPPLLFLYLSGYRGNPPSSKGFAYEILLGLLRVVQENHMG